MIVIKTFVISTNKIKRNWYIVDATDKILGRLSTKVAKLLIGKHKVEYTPNIDLGDYVIIINAKNVSVTGKKFNNKVYYRHTGYIGGIKKFSFRELINRNPKKIIEISVKGMLPKGHLGRVMYRKLKVYSGNVHKHQAQNPKILNF